jgi:hypothetical protein
MQLSSSQMLHLLFSARLPARGWIAHMGICRVKAQVDLFV